MSGGELTIPAYPPPEIRSLVRDEPKRHAATAHFPIAGAAETCRGCAHFVKAERKRGRCAKWAAFMGMGYLIAPAYRAANADWWRGLPTIARDTAACKYFTGEPS